MSADIAKSEVLEPQVSRSGGGEMPVYVPDVDISESAEGTRLLVDMPGATQDSISVTVENGVLRIEGKASAERPEGYDLAGQEYGIGSYRRDFMMTEQVDVNSIKAKLSHGVLELRLPKREEAKAKKIQIES